MIPKKRKIWGAKWTFTLRERAVNSDFHHLLTTSVGLFSLKMRLQTGPTLPYKQVLMLFNPLKFKSKLKRMLINAANKQRVRILYFKKHSLFKGVAATVRVSMVRLLVKTQKSKLSCLKSNFMAWLTQTLPPKNNLWTPHRLVFLQNFSASRRPERMRAPPVESIVNRINLTQRHLPLSRGTVWVMGESLKLRQKKNPRKDKKDWRIFFKGGLECTTCGRFTLAWG